MIRQYLLNKNKSVRVSKTKTFSKLNRALCMYAWCGWSVFCGMLSWDGYIQDAKSADCRARAVRGAVPGPRARDICNAAGTGIGGMHRSHSRCCTRTVFTMHGRSARVTRARAVHAYYSPGRAGGGRTHARVLSGRPAGQVGPARGIDDYGVVWYTLHELLWSIFLPNTYF